MLHKTMRYQVLKPLDESWDTMGNILRDLQYATWKVLNKTIQLHWEYDNLSAEYKAKTGVYPTKDEMKEWSGYRGVEGYAYNALKEEYPIFNGGNLTQTIQQGTKRWKEDRLDVFNGHRSVPSFRRSAPITVNPNNIKIHQDEQGYVATLSLVSMEKLKDLGRKPGGFPLAIIARDNSQRVILNRIISGQYKIGGSKIVHDKKKRKWFFLLTYSFPKQEGHDLNIDNIMGVDLGVATPLYMAFNNSLARYHVNGGEIEQFRRGIEARRRSMLKQGKWCGDGRRGHGKDTRLKPIELLSDRVKNFRDTTNHKYSRYVVDMAIKHNCATIQMEDLSGITEDANRFLKNWTYFDLQTKIEYKAKEAGITVIKINPEYTSQRCSKCGYISRENRKTQAEFRCTECGFEENADYNAAKNISTLGIERLIQEQLVKQNKKQAM